VGGGRGIDGKGWTDIYNGANLTIGYPKVEEKKKNTHATHFATLHTIQKILVSNNLTRKLLLSPAPATEIPQHIHLYCQLVMMVAMLPMLLDRRLKQ